MFNSLPSDPDLLKQVLSPLLEDFQFWFSRSRAFLETERLEFMDMATQQQLLDRVITAQQAVTAAQSLLVATDGQAGVEVALLMGWHQLVMECWGIKTRQRHLTNPIDHPSEN